MYFHSFGAVMLGIQFINGSILLHRFRCQRICLTKSLLLTAFDGLQLDGLPGVEPMTALLKGQADGMCDYHFDFNYVNV